MYNAKAEFKNNMKKTPLLGFVKQPEARAVSHTPCLPPPTLLRQNAEHR